MTNCAISQRPIVTHVCMCMYVSEGSKRDISSTNEVADPHDLRRFMKLQKTWPTQADMLLGWMIGAEIESDAGKNVLGNNIDRQAKPPFL